MTKLTWIGDSDPEAQSVRMSGILFVKGQPTEVKDKDVAAKLATNPMFSADKVESVPADEPGEEELAARAEKGTEKGALKMQLKALGVDVRGNPSVDTLRQKLADASF